MPYSPEHKRKTRARIVEAGRILFNRHGFNGVTIDMVMNEAGLTRGGFYNHFASKEELFRDAIAGFLMGRGAQWRDEEGIDTQDVQPDMARRMVDAYLSDQHLGDVDGQCPMIALPSDVARGGVEAKESFQGLLDAMVWLLETTMDPDGDDNLRHAQSISALCIGGMVLARALPGSDLAHQVRRSAHHAAREILSRQQAGQV